jgi:hypothetical protein
MFHAIGDRHDFARRITDTRFDVHNRELAAYGIMSEQQLGEQLRLFDAAMVALYYKSRSLQMQHLLREATDFPGSDDDALVARRRSELDLLEGSADVMHYEMLRERHSDLSSEYQERFPREAVGIDFTGEAVGIDFTGERNARVDALLPTSTPEAPTPADGATTI